jgi:tRNA nucleotidyltransferase (CCA-adding enzyme)
MRRIKAPEFKLPSDVEFAVRLLTQFGARPYLVGGAVRDLLLGAPIKDYDFEVYGLDADALEGVLRTQGHVQTVGESFGITKLWTRDGHEVDFALPRREDKTGRGHRDFRVAVDPDMDPAEACKRRDFTINALMLDWSTGEVVDYVGGIADLEDRVIRHVSGQFGEDPLRPLRAMQFAARFNLTVAPATAAVCRGMLDEGRELRFERVLAEWEKWARAPHPAAGLRALKDMGWLALYKELDALVGLRQDERHHPEGDVWTHTLLTVDAAARIADEDRLDQGARTALVFAALLHDVGKAVTTEIATDGTVTAKDHAERGENIAFGFLGRIGACVGVRGVVCALIREHMAHLSCPTPSKRNVRRLVDRLKPATIDALGRLVRADNRARPPLGGGDPMCLHVELARLVGVKENGTIHTILKGRHLIALGMRPGPAMGQVLKRAYQAQLDGEFEDADGAIRWAAAELKKEG